MKRSSCGSERRTFGSSARRWRASRRPRRTRRIERGQPSAACAPRARSLVVEGANAHPLVSVRERHGAIVGGLLGADPSSSRPRRISSTGVGLGVDARPPNVSGLITSHGDQKSLFCVAGLAAPAQARRCAQDDQVPAARRHDDALAPAEPLTTPPRRERAQARGFPIINRATVATWRSLICGLCRLELLRSREP